ncbi:hypothetical protein J5U23_01428 [Saccharolobus shibatae B12]|uniref:Glycosyltransferase 2-like domain-containing protein n=1 Tax=Saccharolobus shibatae (strain ATCC 51178 / DSM 5389 / JCM 8931 / NBRC 15437 / B12) TaxID=523848 RepID=A0A8F5GT44_SACSH|nr:glycosyltransferase family 2 protein [Saccharolobus shibatae]QXJ28559.1 hypothetical protein J5U23_01428 [Saccharolobus shibatae B12]
MSKPKISVIITAHMRDMYIDKAFQSILRQEFNKKKIEVVLVHKFPYNNKIKNLMERANLLNNFVDYETKSDPLASKMKEGIELSQGDIICFLEDDDAFATEKSNIVTQKFNEIENLGYFHNDHFIMDEQGYILHKSFINRQKSVIIEGINSENFKDQFKKLYEAKSPQFNSSSICMKRDIIRVDWLEKFRGRRTVDVLLFLMAIESKTRLYFSDLKLTYYRVHKKQLSPHLPKDNKYQLILESIRTDEELLREFKDIESMLTQQTSRDILRLYYYLPTRIARFGLLDISTKVNNLKIISDYMYRLISYIGLREAIKVNFQSIGFHYKRSLFLLLYKIMHI